MTTTTADRRIADHPMAFTLIVSKYPDNQKAHAMNTARCAASMNTPLWQQAVQDAYALTRTGGAA